MNKSTVLITGSSTGIGRETALLFQKNGWNVIATMRSPSRETELSSLENVICPRLDVTDPATIGLAIQMGIQKFGKIDVLVNNAGFGLTGPFESTSDEQILRQYDTNVIGLMRVTKAILPHFRKQKSGMVINISSIAGRVAFPFFSLYHGTKWAVEGFTESLRYELEPLGIRVKLIEPGAIVTDFYGRSADDSWQAAPSDYLERGNLYRKIYSKAGATGLTADRVAMVIWKAATDGSYRLRYAIGKGANPLLFLRRLLPDSWYRLAVKLATKQ